MNANMTKLAPELGHNNTAKGSIMKCIKSGEKIRRVSDQEASALVKKGWAYCPKKLWKEEKQ